MIEIKITAPDPKDQPAADDLARRVTRWFNDHVYGPPWYQLRPGPEYNLSPLDALEDKDHPTPVP